MNRISPEKEARVITLLRSGLSIRQVQQATGIAKETIHRRQKELRTASHPTAQDETVSPGAADRQPQQRPAETQVINGRFQRLIKLRENLRGQVQTYLDALSEVRRDLVQCEALMQQAEAFMEQLNSDPTAADHGTGLRPGMRVRMTDKAIQQGLHGRADRRKAIVHSWSTTKKRLRDRASGRRKESQ